MLWRDLCDGSMPYKRPIGIYLWPLTGLFQIAKSEIIPTLSTTRGVKGNHNRTNQGHATLMTARTLRFWLNCLSSVEQHDLGVIYTDAGIPGPCTGWHHYHGSTILIDLKFHEPFKPTHALAPDFLPEINDKITAFLQNLMKYLIFANLPKDRNNINYSEHPQRISASDTTACIGVYKLNKSKDCYLIAME